MHVYEKYDKHFHEIKPVQLTDCSSFFFLQDVVSARQILDDVAPRQRKGSILRAASALAGGVDEQEDITYTPLKAWTKQSTTKELIQEKEVRRNRFGWEVDFPDFEMPFNKNVTKKVEEMGGADDD